MTALAFYLATLILGLAGMMIAPAIVSVGANDLWGASIFLLCGFGTATMASLVILALRDISGEMNRFSGLVLVVFGWPILAAIAAFPLIMLTETSFGFGFFETLSAITTTGMTLYKSLETVPRSIIMWLAVLQAYGGFLTLVMLVFVLSPLGIGGLVHQRVSFTSMGVTEQQAHVGSQVRQLGLGYSILVLACCSWLLGAGVDPFAAICLALSTVSTGGLVPVQQPLEAFVPAAGQLGLIVFMFFGATSVVWLGWLIRLDREQLARHRESYALMMYIFILGGVFALMYWHAAGAGAGKIGTVLREGLFAGASLVTTTGFHVREESFSVLPLAALIAVAMIGGGAISTAGGIKIFRIGILSAHSHRQMLGSLFPSGIHSGVIGSRRWSQSEIQSIYILVISFVFLGGTFAALLAARGLNFSESIAASMAALANIGPLYGGGPDAAFPWIHPADMDNLSRGVLGTAMIVGRIEILALFSAINIAYWRLR